MNEKKFEKREQRGDDKAGANRPKDLVVPRSLAQRFMPVVIGIAVGALGTAFFVGLSGRDSSLPVAKDARNVSTPVATTPMVAPPVAATPVAATPEGVTPAMVTPATVTPATAWPGTTQPAVTEMQPAPAGPPPINNVDPMSGEPITPKSPTVIYKGQVVAFCCRNSKAFNGGWQNMSEADKDAFVGRWVK